MLYFYCYRPYTGIRKGVSNMDFALSFIITVMAGVVCHLICKWLDRDE